MRIYRKVNLESEMNLWLHPTQLLQICKTYWALDPIHEVDGSVLEKEK